MEELLRKISHCPSCKTDLRGISSGFCTCGVFLCPDCLGVHTNQCPNRHVIYEDGFNYSSFEYLQQFLTKLKDIPKSFGNNNTNDFIFGTPPSVTTDDLNEFYTSDMSFPIKVEQGVNLNYERKMDTSFSQLYETFNKPAREGGNKRLYLKQSRDPLTPIVKPKKEPDTFIDSSEDENDFMISYQSLPSCSTLLDTKHNSSKASKRRRNLIKSQENLQVSENNNLMAYDLPEATPPIAKTRRMHYQTKKKNYSKRRRQPLRAAKKNSVAFSEVEDMPIKNEIPENFSFQTLENSNMKNILPNGIHGSQILENVIHDSQILENSNTRNILPNDIHGSQILENSNMKNILPSCTHDSLILENSNMRNILPNDILENSNMKNILPSCTHDSLILENSNMRNILPNDIHGSQILENSNMKNILSSCTHDSLILENSNMRNILPNDILENSNMKNILPSCTHDSLILENSNMRNILPNDSQIFQKNGLNTDITNSEYSSLENLDNEDDLPPVEVRSNVLLENNCGLVEDKENTDENSLARVYGIRDVLQGIPTQFYHTFEKRSSCSSNSPNSGNFSPESVLAEADFNTDIISYNYARNNEGEVIKEEFYDNEGKLEAIETGEPSLGTDHSPQHNDNFVLEEITSRYYVNLCRQDKNCLSADYQRSISPGANRNESYVPEEGTIDNDNISFGEGPGAQGSLVVIDYSERIIDDELAAPLQTQKPLENPKGFKGFKDSQRYSSLMKKILNEASSSQCYQTTEIIDYRGGRYKITMSIEELAETDADQPSETHTGVSSSTRDSSQQTDSEEEIDDVSSPEETSLEEERSDDDIIEGTPQKGSLTISSLDASRSYFCSSPNVNEETRDVYEEEEPSKRFLIATSRLSQDDRRTVKRFAEVAGHSFTTSIYEKYDVLIVPSDCSEVRDTFKFLVALASKAPIVSMSWIEDSIKSNELVPTEPYLVFKEEGPMRSLTSVQPPLTGITIVTQLLKEEIDIRAIENVCEMGGATVIKQIDKLDSPSQNDAPFPRFFLFKEESQLTSQLLNECSKHLVLAVSSLWAYKCLENYNTVPIVQYLPSTFVLSKDLLINTYHVPANLVPDNILD